MKDDVYKPSPDWEKEMEEEVRLVLKKVKSDPVFLGVLLHKLIEERENTNRLLKTLISKIERIEKALSHEQRQPQILSDIDQRIYEFVKQKGMVTAEDVMKAFNYKGQNGASARLNKLYSMGLLNKTHAGKKVYYYAGKV